MGSHVALGLKGQGEMELTEPSESHSVVSDSLRPHGLHSPWNSQARILEWVAVSRGSSQPSDQTHVSCIAGGFFTNWATSEAQEYWSGYPIPSSVDLPNLGIEPGSPMGRFFTNRAIREALTEPRKCWNQKGGWPVAGCTYQRDNMRAGRDRKEKRGKLECSQW